MAALVVVVVEVHRRGDTCLGNQGESNNAKAYAKAYVLAIRESQTMLRPMSWQSDNAKALCLGNQSGRAKQC